ncbi:MAG: hypothetical protein LBI30_03580 [Holosporales bacterium]|nr:hypothetical protein [Holosporales bacterium]
MTIKNTLLAGSVVLLGCSYSDAALPTILLEKGRPAVTISDPDMLGMLNLQGEVDLRSVDYKADPRLKHMALLVEGGLDAVNRAAGLHTDSPYAKEAATPGTVRVLNWFAALLPEDNIREAVHDLLDACCLKAETDPVQSFIKLYGALTVAGMI